MKVKRPMTQESVDLFKRIREQFKLYYGRDLKGNDFALPFSPIYKDEVLLEIMKK